jgi:hypothetical protein
MLPIPASSVFDEMWGVDELLIAETDEYRLYAEYKEESDMAQITVSDRNNIPVRRMMMDYNPSIVQETVVDLYDQYGITDGYDSDDESEIAEREIELREYTASFLEDVCLFDEHMAQLDDDEIDAIMNSIINLLGRKYGFSIYRPVMIDGERVDYPYDAEREVEVS